MQSLRTYTDDALRHIRKRMEIGFVEILTAIQRLTPVPAGRSNTPPDSPLSPPPADHSSPPTTNTPTPLADQLPLAPMDPLAPVDPLVLADPLVVVDSPASIADTDPSTPLSSYQTLDDHFLGLSLLGPIPLGLSGP